MTTCRVCDRPHYAKGFCSLHYQRFVRGVPLDAPAQTRAPRRLVIYNCWVKDCWHNAYVICTVDGCYGKPKAHGLCDRCLQRWYGRGSVELEELVCGLPGCTDKRGSGAARGFCKRHYRNWWRHGDPLGAEIPGGRDRRPPETERAMTKKIRADLRSAETMRSLDRRLDVHYLVQRATTYGRKLTRLEREFADGVTSGLAKREDHR